MLKKDMELQLKEYKDILWDISKWCFPHEYKIGKDKALFHIKGIQKVLTKRFYKESA